MYKKVFKRLLDIFFALLGLIISSPILVVSIVYLTLDYIGNPFFLQSRPGKNEKIFKIIKLKTMKDLIDSNGNMLPDSKRLTKVGYLLRKLSIDELPQLVNIIKGDMSLIGPRPLLEEYLPLYSDYHKRRHEVLPGITGLAQVNGRQSIKLSKRRDYDVKYVDNLTFKLDLEIFIKTIMKVLTRTGVKSGQTIDVVDDLGFIEKLNKK